MGIDPISRPDQKIGSERDHLGSSLTRPICMPIYILIQSSDQPSQVLKSRKIQTQNSKQEKVDLR